MNDKVLQTYFEHNEQKMIVRKIRQAVVLTQRGDTYDVIYVDRGIASVTNTSETFLHRSVFLTLLMHGDVCLFVSVSGWRKSYGL